MAGAGCFLSESKAIYKSNHKFDVPAYLQHVSADFQRDPRKTNLDWFKDARFGLFLHYGLYSILGKGEWSQLTEKIPVAEYARLKNEFKADRFDADFITDLALEAGMKYINITTKHHDGFCLFNSKYDDFTSVHSPARRDLVQELSVQCNKKGLALFLYYSYGVDWRHPYFFPNHVGWDKSRPDYASEQPEYQYKEKADFKKYIQYTHTQFGELLTQYPGVAGIWLDPIMGFYKNPDFFPIAETYQHIRSFQPHTLIAFKQGANGDEDYVAPERTPRAHTEGGPLGLKVWEMNKYKPKEICDTLQPKDIPGSSWGYNTLADGKHVNEHYVVKMLEQAASVNANLLLNIGPKGDGSIPEEDILTLKKIKKISSYLK